jgi:hypothetical protein
LENLADDSKILLLPKSSPKEEKGNHDSIFGTQLNNKNAEKTAADLLQQFTSSSSSREGSSRLSAYGLNWICLGLFSSSSSKDSGLAPNISLLSLSMLLLFV